MLFGWIFFMPIVGAAIGGAMGALAGHFTDYGIGNDFIQQVRSKVTEGTSALFLLVGQVTTDRVVEAFKAAPKFEIIASNLSHEQEEKLKEAFAHYPARVVEGQGPNGPGLQSSFACCWLAHQ